MSGEREALDLPDAAAALLDECRMVLPGVQAIFGFQLIAVFNQRFGEEFGPLEQRLHLAALALVALAAALVMTPAAYHRLREARSISQHFIDLSSRLLLLALVPLAVGLSLDFYLIAQLVLGAGSLPATLAVALGAVMIFLWFVFPRLAGR